ncbi:AI-2E family transporter [Persicobacter psychrovividus]|uniref:AI-2E family transporter n=1 Tax=Persicobacter psychrovividus TaxID=387638 RepID=A0ABM7VC18_9BACT|nr:AI-2E family transporter [Persicobacter psychrovividus]
MKHLLTLYVILGFVLFVFLAWMFSDIFVYITLALIVSTFLSPLVNYFSRKRASGWHFSRIGAIILAFLIFSAVITFFVLLFVPLISEQITVLKSLNIDKMIDLALEPVGMFEHFLRANGLTQKPSGFLETSIGNGIEELLANIEVSTLLNNVISVTGNLLVGVLAVFFISFFFLLENGYLRRKFIGFVPNKYFELFVSTFQKAEKLLTNYLLGLQLQMFSIFGLAAVGLTIVDIRYAATIALFAAIANLIPYLGPMLGAIFGVIVGMSTSVDLFTYHDYLIMMLKIAAVFGMVQLIDNLVLQPVIFSKSIKAHPLEIFIIIFAGANLLGVVGMVFAIPAYTILRVTFVELRESYTQYHIFNKN